MLLNLLLPLTAGLLSALAAAGIESFVRRYRHKARGQQPSPKTYQERLSELTSSLAKASGEVDSVLREIGGVATERTEAIRKLEHGLAALEKREKELKEKIDVLQNVPIPVAEQFAKLVEPTERKSAKRDYLLFFAGVVVTTVIAVILQLVFKK